MRALRSLDLVLSNNHLLGDTGFRAIAGSVLRQPQLVFLRLECFGCALAEMSVCTRASRGNVRECGLPRGDVPAEQPA